MSSPSVRATFEIHSSVFLITIQSDTMSAGEGQTCKPDSPGWLANKQAIWTQSPLTVNDVSSDSVGRFCVTPASQLVCQRPSRNNSASFLNRNAIATPLFIAACITKAPERLPASCPSGYRSELTDRIRPREGEVRVLREIDPEGEVSIPPTRDRIAELEPRVLVLLDHIKVEREPEIGRNDWLEDPWITRTGIAAVLSLSCLRPF